MNKKLLAWMLLILIVMSSFSGCTLIKKNEPEENAKKTEKSQKEKPSKKQAKTEKEEDIEEEEEEKEEQAEEEQERSKKPKKDRKNKEKDSSDSEEKNSVQEDRTNKKGKADKKEPSKKDEEDSGPKKDKSGKNRKDKTDKQEQPETAKAPNKSAPEAFVTVNSQMEATKAYSKILSTIYDIIETGTIDFEKYMGETGILNTIRDYGQTRLFELFGYYVTDISGDGVPELIIGNMQTDPTSPLVYVYSVHTLVNGEPYLVFESGVGNNYCASPEGKIYYYGDEDNYRFYELSQLSKNGKDLICLDFYYSIENYHISETNYYHNKLGYIDVDNSTLLSISAEEFSAYNDNLIQQMSPIGLFPFTAYDRRNGQTFGVIPRKTNIEEESLFNTTVITINPNPQTDVSLWPSRPIKNLKLLALEHYFDDKGKTRYKTKEIDSFGDADIELSFLLRMTFTGYYATVGFSFEEDGRTKKYALHMDKDTGSIYLMPF